VSGTYSQAGHVEFGNDEAPDLLERKHLYLKCSSHLQDVGVVGSANGHSNLPWEQGVTFC
jgi:hypothetical protein